MVTSFHIFDKPLKIQYFIGFVATVKLPVERPLPIWPTDPTGYTMSHMSCKPSRGPKARFVSGDCTGQQGKKIQKKQDIYSVRGLEQSELGGSHGFPGRLWDRFLWQIYQNGSRHDALDGVYICHKNRSQRRPGQPLHPPNSLRSKPRTEYRRGPFLYFNGPLPPNSPHALESTLQQVRLQKCFLSFLSGEWIGKPEVQYKIQTIVWWDHWCLD